MKTTALLTTVLAALLAAVAFGDPATQPASLIANGDFQADADADGKPDGWPTPNGASWETEDGNRFLRMRAGTAGEAVVAFRAVDIPADVNALRLSYRVRHEGIKVGKQNYFDGRIMMTFKAADGTAAKPGPKAPSFRGSSDGWKAREQVIPVPHGAATLEVLLTLFKAEAGTIDYDDVALVAVPAEARVRPEPLATQPTPPTPASARTVEPPAADKLPPALKVVGNQIQTPDGKTVWLQGVSIPSLEWSVKGENVLKSVEVAIDGWKANCIRLPVQEDKWFGKGPYQKDGGIGYRAVVDDAISLTAGRGCYLVLDLHRFRAPEENHVVFWNDVAARYKDHPAILFELFNEPHGISWEVWQKGGPVTDKPKKDGVVSERAEPLKRFDSVGMQKLLDTVRATGAKNPVIVGGLDWGYDLSGILNGHALDDRGGHGIIYSSHVYPWKSNWQGKFLDLADKYPLFIGELGAEVERMPFIPPERHEDPHKWSPDMIGAIQKHKLHWTGWCFHPKSSPKMLTGWDYEPTPYWGAYVKRALAGEQFEMKKAR